MDDFGIYYLLETNEYEVSKLLVAHISPLRISNLQSTVSQGQIGSAQPYSVEETWGISLPAR